MKQYANKRRSDQEFEEGEKVYLKLRYPRLKAFNQGSVSKLSPWYFGPFNIAERIGKVAYKLQLPEGTNIHPVFHLSLLKRSTGAELVDTVLLAPCKGKEGPMEPEAIMDRRVVHHQGVPLIQVLVKWEQRSNKDNTWEYLPGLLQRFPRAASLLSIS